MRLVKITEDLYVNPERVVSVERRTTTRSNGAEYTYVELALETMIRWTLDIPLSDVVLALDPHRGELR